MVKFTKPLCDKIWRHRFSLRKLLHFQAMFYLFYLLSFLTLCPIVICNYHLHGALCGSTCNARKKHLLSSSGIFLYKDAFISFIFTFSTFVCVATSLPIVMHFKNNKTIAYDLCLTFEACHCLLMGHPPSFNLFIVATLQNIQLFFFIVVRHVERGRYRNGNIRNIILINHITAFL